MANGNGKKRTAKTIETGGIKKSPLINPMKPFKKMGDTYDAIPFRNKDIDKISLEPRKVLAKTTTHVPLTSSNRKVLAKTTTHVPAPVSGRLMSTGLRRRNP